MIPMMTYNILKQALCGVITAVFVSCNSFVSAQSLTAYISQFNASEAQSIANSITAKSKKYGLDPLLLTALIKTESNFQNDAVSSAGARGYSQLMPDTADYLGVNPYDGDENIEGGAKYLRELIDSYANTGSYQYNYALAAYNAGPGNVTNHIPSYTYDYIQTIQSDYYALQRLIRDVPAPTKNQSAPTEIDKKQKLLQLYQLKKIKELAAHTRY